MWLLQPHGWNRKKRARIDGMIELYTMVFLSRLPRKYCKETQLSLNYSQEITKAGKLVTPIVPQPRKIAFCCSHPSTHKKGTTRGLIIQLKKNRCKCDILINRFALSLRLMRAGEPLKLPPMKTFFALVTQSSSSPLVTPPFSNSVRWNSWRKIRMEYIRILLDNGKKDSGAPSTLRRGNPKKKNPQSSVIL